MKQHFIPVIIAVTALVVALGILTAGAGTPVVRADSLAISGTASVEMAEADTTKVGSYSVNAGEDDDITWSLSGTDRYDFEFDETHDGIDLHFKKTPDYESPVDSNRDNEYLVTLNARAGSQNSSLAVTVTVTDVSGEHKIVIDGARKVTVDENTTGDLLTLTATDPTPNAGEIRWTLSNDYDFTITSAGVLQLTNPQNYETLPDDGGDDRLFGYVNVHAISDSSFQDSHKVTLYVADVDEAPEILGNDTTSVDENPASFLVDYFTAYDPENDNITWSLSGTDSGDFTIDQSGSLSFKSNPDYESPADSNRDNEYLVTVRASDGKKTSSLAVTVTVNDIAVEGPVVTGNAAPTFAENRTGTITTYGATNHQSATVTWSLATSRPDSRFFNIDSESGALSFKSPPNYESKSSYSLKVYVKAGGLSGERDVTVTVTDVDEAPEISGPDTISVDENPASFIVGYYSAYDPDGDDITWSLSGTDGGDFTIDQTGALSFRSNPNYESPADSNRNNEYLVTVRARGGSPTTTLAVTVTVTDVTNEAPVVTGNKTPSFAENRTGTVATYSARDEEGDAITWSLGGDDAGDFTITNGALSFAADPNYEAPADADSDNIYKVTVRAGDGVNTGALDVAVSVTDANDAPEIDGSDSPELAEADKTLVQTYSVSDPDNDDIHWSLSGTDSGDFTIEDGELHFKLTPDYENPADSNRDNEYLVTVRASDGKTTSSLAVTVTVTDVDASAEGIVIDGARKVSVPENTTRNLLTLKATDPNGGAVTWSLQAEEANAPFSVSSNGVVKVTSPLDFETRSTYTLNVDANSDVSSGDRHVIVVTVTNVNEPPAFEEGLATSLTKTESADKSVFTFTATDPENDDITWSLSGADSGDFTIDQNGSLSFRNAPDYETPADSNRDNEYLVTVRARDSSLTGSIAVTVTVLDTNEPPVVKGNATPSFAENGEGVVATYTAIDPEGDEFTWSVTGDDNNSFNISQSGALTFVKPPDYENSTSYSIKIRAGLSAKHYGDLDVTVTITDVDEAPVLTGVSTATFIENDTAVVATFTAEDAEKGEITWSLGGDDKDDFTFSEGALSFASPPTTIPRQTATKTTNMRLRLALPTARTRCRSTSRSP